MLGTYGPASTNVSANSNLSDSKAAQLSKLVRVVRMVRLIRLVKLYKYMQVYLNPEKVSEEHQSFIGSAMSDILSRRYEKHNASSSSRYVILFTFFFVVE